MKSYVRTALIAAGLSTLSLVAACHSAPTDNQVESTEVNIAPEANVIDTNITEPTVTTPVTNAAPPAATTSKNDFGSAEQTQQDADATGMTSKLPGDNEAQPAH